MNFPLIIFGGTFDPIHTAHLVLAESAAEELHAETILFVPAGDPPHKTGCNITPAEDRLAMVKAAIDDNPHFRLSTVELERPGRSYAIDTIRQICSDYPDQRPPGYLIGSDSLLDLHIWKNPEQILGESSVLVVPRPGFDPANVQSDFHGRFHLLETPRFDLSATEIRKKVRKRESIRYLVPEAVRRHIEKRGLYRTARRKDVDHAR